jgi:hypothetical protein
VANLYTTVMPPKKPLAFLLLMLCTLTGAAQDTFLKGNVKNLAGQFLSTAVVITPASSDSIIKTGFFENGVILIPKIPIRLFVVKISSFNHADTSILVAATTSETDLGTITLSQVRKLENVTVKAKAPLFKKTTEGTRVNVESTMLSASVNTSEVLAKSPGLTVGKTGVTVFGKGDALIYLNGKPITYELMMSIPVNRIKSVDIITNPSAKYESKGMAVINIITKKGNGPEGFMGELTQSATFAHHYINDAAINVNFKRKKLSLTGDYNSEQGTDWLKGNMGKKFNYSFGDYTTKTVHEENTYNAMNSYRMGINYNINPKSDFSVQYDGLYNEYDLGVDMDNNITDPTDTITRIGVFNNGFTGNYNHSLNANYNRSLDSLGSTLFVAVQYSRFHNQLYDQIRERVNRPGSPESDNLRVNDGDNLFKLFTAQADLVKMYKNGNKIETGMRLAEITNEGRVIFKSKTTNAGDWTISPSLSNSSLYTEKVPAVYVQYYGSLNEKMSYAAGLRTELSQVTAFSRALNKMVVDTTYPNLFPNARFNYTISNKWSASFSYSGRINRPVYQNIDPFVWYLDNLTSIQGNPKLIPELINSYEAVFTYKNHSLKMGYSHIKNSMQGVALPGNGGNNSAIFTTQNLKKRELYNASLDIPVETKIWTSYNTLSINIEKVSDNRADFISQGVTPQLYIYTYNQVKIPKVFDIDLSAQFLGRKKNGLGDAKEVWFANWGISRLFLNKKLSVRVTMDDFLRTRRFVGYNVLGHITSTFDSRMNSHLLRITVKYKFGALKNITYKNKSVNDDEFNRIMQ